MMGDASLRYPSSRTAPNLRLRMDASLTFKGSRGRGGPRKAIRASTLACVCSIFITRSLVAAAGETEVSATAPDVKVGDGVPSPASATVPSAPSEPRQQSEPRHATPPVHTEAEKLLWDGMHAFEQADFRRAVLLFERSYALQPNSAMLFNLARGHARLGDCAAARLYLQRYLKEEPSPPPGFYEGAMALEEDCPEPSAEPLAPSPATSVPIETPSAFVAPVVPETNRASESRASRRALPRAPGSDERSVWGTSYDTWGYGLLAAGGASAVVSVIYGLKAAGTNRELETLASELGRDPSRTWDDASEPLITREAREDTLAVTFGVSALALGTAGLVLLLAPEVDEQSPATEPMPHASVQVRGGGRGVWAGYGGTF